MYLRIYFPNGINKFQIKFNLLNNQIKIINCNIEKLNREGLRIKRWMTKLEDYFGDKDITKLKMWL